MLYRHCFSTLLIVGHKEVSGKPGSPAIKSYNISDFVYVDCVSILGGSVRTIKKNTGASVVAS
jgi:hypothetical protein